MKRLGMSRAGVCIATALLLICGSALRAQVLQQIPSDALVVLKVNNLKSASDKFAKLGQDLGLAAMAPEMADPLGALQAKLKIQQGLKTDGEMAFVFLDPATVGGDEDQAMLILIPVTDYKAFLGNFPDAKTEGEVSEVKLAEDPKPGYVANWGGYAALSPSKDTVSKKPSSPGIKLPPITTKEMASKDAIVYANFAAIKAKALPKLKEARGQVATELDNNLTKEPKVAKYAPAIKSLVNQAMNVAEGFLNDVQSASWGITIVPEGINSTLMAEFTPGSYSANLVANMKNTDAVLLTGIPAGKYLVYGGSIGDPTSTVKAFSDFIDPVAKEVAAIGPEMKPINDYIAAMKGYIGATKGQTFGMVAPTGAVGADPLIQFIMLQTGDAKTMQSSYHQIGELQPEIMKAFNVPGADAMKPTLTANAKTVDGVSFDQMVTKVDMNAQDAAAMQQAQMMTMMYGPQGAVVNYGVLGTDKMLVVSGVSDQVISSAIAAAKGNQAPLADNDKVKAVAAQLPKARAGVLYIPVDDIVTTGLSYAKQFGFAMNVQLPPDLPPVGVAVGAEGSAVRVDSHVPTTLVQSLVAAGMQAAMQMQGGGAPKGGGL